MLRNGQLLQCVHACAQRATLQGHRAIGADLPPLLHNRCHILGANLIGIPQPLRLVGLGAQSTFQVLGDPPELIDLVPHRILCLRLLRHSFAEGDGATLQLLLQALARFLVLGDLLQRSVQLPMHLVQLVLSGKFQTLHGHQMRRAGARLDRAQLALLLQSPHRGTKLLHGTGQHLLLLEQRVASIMLGLRLGFNTRHGASIVHS
mmetsp:Transcript_107436/g.272612  ORF Transcript_107436/g.272612 Transcript_107436/m.272612 type:complete len:205 (+) Transcript_107436:329-943(+)